MDNPFFLYLLKVSISLVFFYAVYMLCMRHDTFFRLKRFYFLLSIAFSALYPVLRIPIAVDSAKTIPSYWLTQMELNTLTAPSQAEAPVEVQSLVLLLLFLISLLLLVRLLVQLASIIRLRYRSETSILDAFVIVKLRDTNSSPFSFFYWIFIPLVPKKEALREIIAHEQVHARKYHSVDILVAEIFCIFFWWNPIAWLLRHEMKINLEYLADEGVLSKGFDRQTYQYTLVQLSNTGTNNSLIINFNVSQLKKRIAMMNKKKNAMSVAAKYLLALPLGCILVFGNAERVSASLIESSTPSQGLTLPQEPIVKKQNKKDKKTGVLVTNDGEKKMVELVIEKDASGGKDTTIVVTGWKEKKGKGTKKTAKQSSSTASEKKDPFWIKKPSQNALIILDGKIITDMEGIDPQQIESFSVLKGESMKEYGDAAKGKEGVIVITSKLEKAKE